MRMSNVRCARSIAAAAALLGLMGVAQAIEISAKQLHDRCSSDAPMSIMGCGSYILGFVENERSQPQPRFCVPVETEVNVIAFGFAAFYAATKATGPAAPVLAAFLKQDHPCKT